MAKRRGPGRPPRAGNAAEGVVKLRVTPGERQAWERQARLAEVSLSEWARRRLGDGIAVRIVVEPDEDEWYWRAFDRHGNKLDGGTVASADPRAVIRCVEGDHGVSVDEDVAVEVLESR